MDNDPARYTPIPRMKICSFLLMFCLGLLAPGLVAAQVNWRDMPPDERHQLRQQMRQQMREHWEAEHESRREASRNERREANEPGRWRDIPPEDRRRMREEMRDQRPWGSEPHRPPKERPEGRGWRSD